MKKNKLSDFWVTPPHFFPDYNFDPCPVNPNFDGLKIKWHGDVFCNPPYSQIELWIKKALQERENCKSIIMLLPNWTDRKWFSLIQEFPIKFTKGRIRFLNPKTMLPEKTPRFGSMFVKIL